MCDGQRSPESVWALLGEWSDMKAYFLLVLAAVFPSICMADPAAIQRCRLVADSLERLRCYDAIPLSPGRAEEPGKAAETPRSSPPSAPGAAPSAAGAPKEPAAQFGLEHRRQPPSVPESMDSSIAGRFDGWVGNSRIRLANGQIWEIRDGSQAAYNLRDPKVRVVRGVSGSFFMEIEGVAQSPRVRRVVE